MKLASENGDKEKKIVIMMKKREERNEVVVKSVENGESVSEEDGKT